MCKKTGTLNFITENKNAAFVAETIKQATRMKEIGREDESCLKCRSSQCRVQTR